MNSAPFRTSESSVYSHRIYMSRPTLNNFNVNPLHGLWGWVGTMDHRAMYESWIGTTLDEFSTLQNPQMMCLCQYRMDIETTLLDPRMVLSLHFPSNGWIWVQRMTFLSWLETTLDGFNTVENPHIHHSPTSIGDSSLEISPLLPFPVLSIPFFFFSPIPFSPQIKKSKTKTNL